MGSERSQNAPGERGPAGAARHLHTPGSRLPLCPARSLGASRGPRGAAGGFGIGASAGQEEQRCQREHGEGRGCRHPAAELEANHGGSITYRRFLKGCNTVQSPVSS